MNETIWLSANETWIIPQGEALRAPSDGTLTIRYRQIDPPTIASFVVSQLGFPFTALAEWSTDGRFVTIDWGDGSEPETIDNASEATHVYSNTGNFSVTLSVQNGVGATSAVRNIAIRTQPAEIISFAVTQQPEGKPEVSAVWEVFADSVYADWGDGYRSGPFSEENSASHAYRQVGRYFVTLTAANEEGAVSETMMIEVVATECGLAEVYSRFDRLAIVKTSIGRGDMA